MPKKYNNCKKKFLQDKVKKLIKNEKYNPGFKIKFSSKDGMPALIKKLEKLKHPEYKYCNTNKKSDLITACTKLKIPESEYTGKKSNQLQQLLMNKLSKNVPKPKVVIKKQYSISDYDSDFFDSYSDEEKRGKFIPDWAKKSKHKKEVIKQKSIDPDTIFKLPKKKVDLELLFKQYPSKYNFKNRSPQSEDWEPDKLTKEEEIKYKQAMGWLKENEKKNKHREKYYDTIIKDFRKNISKDYYRNMSGDKLLRFLTLLNKDMPKPKDYDVEKFGPLYRGVEKFPDKLIMNIMKYNFVDRDKNLKKINKIISKKYKKISKAKKSTKVKKSTKKLIKLIDEYTENFVKGRDNRNDFRFIIKDLILGYYKAKNNNKLNESSREFFAIGEFSALVKSFEKFKDDHAQFVKIIIEPIFKKLSKTDQLNIILSYNGSYLSQYY